MNIYRLLFIQDNSLVGNFYREKLEHAGFLVQSVSSLEEGRRKMETTPPDVVVLDPLLPDGEAAESITAIRSERGAETLPIFVLPTQQRVLAEAIEQNAKTHLLQQSGYTPKTLIEAAAGAVEMAVEGLDAVMLNCQPDDRWRRAVLAAAPAAVAEIRQTLHSIIRNPAAHENLRVLLQNVHRFADQMTLLGPNALSQVSSALEILVYGLVQYPERLEPLTMRTLGQAVDFLAELLASPRATEQADLSSAHVMIVEDEPNARELIVAAMGLVGLSADGLDTPGTSLAVLSVEACDLIFLDINLPEMNGFELCTKLRAMPMHERTPIVFLTGMNSFQNRVQSNLSGGNDFVGKPFNVAELGVKALIWVLRGQFGLN